jgi:hypothetical protein
MHDSRDALISILTSTSHFFFKNVDGLSNFKTDPIFVKDL